MYLEAPFPRNAKHTLVRPHKNLTSTEIVDYSYLKGEELEKNEEAFRHFFQEARVAFRYILYLSAVRIILYTHVHAAIYS